MPPVEVCRPLELGADELSAWARLQATDPRFDSPFLSATFAHAMDAVDARTRVAVVRDGGAVVGLLPFTSRWPGVAGVLGETLTTRQALLHDPAHKPDVARWLSEAGIATWEFSALVPTSVAPAPHCRPTFSHVVDLSAGYESYRAWLAAESKKYASWVRRKRQHIEADLGPISFRSGEPDPAAFGQLLTWKSEQYRRSGWRDPLSHSWVRALLDVLADERAGDLSGCLSTIVAGDELLAGDFSLYSGSTFAGWFVAYNPAFARYSPGAVHFTYLVGRTAELGLTAFDIGPGDEDYKHRMANSRLDLITGRVERPGVRAAVRRLQTAPVQFGREFVVRHPPVRGAVRRGLHDVGSVRTRLSRRVASGPSDS